MCAELISIVLIFFNIQILTEMLMLLDRIFCEHWFTGLTKFYYWPGTKQRYNVYTMAGFVLFQHSSKLLATCKI